MTYHWHCPKCGARIRTGKLLAPPLCTHRIDVSTGHKACEMTLTKTEERPLR